MGRPAKILIVEDDEPGRELALFNLRKAGHDPVGCGDGEEALSLCDAEAFDLVITDVRMPKMSGLDLLRQIKARRPSLPVIVVTAYGNVQTAVTAMKEGAFDFIGKPFNRDHMLLVVDKALAATAMQREVERLRRLVAGVERPIIFRSEVMQRILDTADKLAGSDVPVLITGESGTGKELVARRIHARSARAEGPFVAVNCGALPDQLIESELFGHVSGAFTGASGEREGRFRRAQGGTLLLDEIGDLPLPVQGKLLRVLQEGLVDVLGTDKPVSIDVRLLAATNQDLEEKVARGSFRQDLFYRINVVEIRLPPLRERPEDIEPLVRHFIDLHSEGRRMDIPDQLLGELERMPWPGNVRELENVCRRLVVLAGPKGLSSRDIPKGRGGATGGGQDLDWLTLPEDGLSLIDLEQAVIRKVLAHKKGNVSQTAAYLGIPRHVLAYRLTKYGIDPKAYG